MHRLSTINMELQLLVCSLGLLHSVVKGKCMKHHGVNCHHLSQYMARVHLLSRALGPMCILVQEVLPRLLLLFYFILFYFLKFIYLFLAVLGLRYYVWAFSLAAASGGYSLLRCLGFSFCGGFSSLQSTSSRCMGFSSCSMQALERRLSSCGTRA